MPAPGRLVLTPMLNQRGRLIGDFTIAKAAGERFLMWGSSQAQRYHMRWFETQLPADGSVRIRRYDMGLVGVSIAGPRSREVLSGSPMRMSATPHCVSWIIARWTSRTCRPMINRVSYTGDLGYEIWVAPEYQRAAVHRRHGGGRDLGIVELRHARAAVHAAREEFPHLVPRAAPHLRRLRGRQWSASSTSPRTDFIGREAATQEKATGGTAAQSQHGRRRDRRGRARR